MLEQMPARTFAAWQAFYEIDPFGDQRADLRAGIVAATAANCWRGKGDRPLKPIDFMPFYERPRQSSEEMRHILDTIIGAVSG
jgi:hypothetical protein